MTTREFAQIDFDIPLLDDSAHEHYTVITSPYEGEIENSRGSDVLVQD